ncbi:MAG: hypothetical protein COA78_02320, partial [Blastopirellula sp.]
MKRFVVLLGLCVFFSHVSYLAGDERPASKQPVLLKFNAFQQPEDAKTEAVLSQKTEFVFTDTPLEDVVEFVSALHDIEVRVNKRALEEVGLAVDTPITRNLNGISLRSALRLVLSELELTYYVEQGTIVITTHEDSEEKVKAKFFKLQPMLAKPHVRLEQLASHIRKLIAPDSWDTVGGYGTLCPTGAGFVLQQTQQNRRAVVRFLTVYNQLLAPHKSAVTDIAPARNPRIQAALEQRLDTIDFVDTPLAEAIDFLQQVLDISIQIDTRALDDVGLDTGETINITLAKGHTARYVIDTILKERELIAIDHQETLFVTTEEVNETLISLRAYSMNGLLSATDQDGNSLVALVTTSVHADSWNAAGGPGQIMQDRATNSLFVLQTQETHAAIANLLDQMRPDGTFEKVKKETEKPGKILNTKLIEKYNSFKKGKNAPYSEAPDPFGDDKSDNPFGDEPFTDGEFEGEEVIYEEELELDFEAGEEGAYGEDEFDDDSGYGEEYEGGGFDRESKRKKRRAKRDDENYGGGDPDGA